MVSMQDIADKAGVSRVTVSRVLSNHPSVKAETRQKVLHWVKELDYEPNLIAQSLAGNRTNLIGLLVLEIAYPFFSEIIESIENQAFYEGYSVIICNTHRSLEKEKNILAQLRQRKVDGVIAVPVSTKQSLPAYQRLQVPAVMITKKMEGFSSVYISHFNGGEQIAKHFLNMGFQKIGYIGPTRESSSLPGPNVLLPPKLPFLRRGHELPDLRLRPDVEVGADPLGVKGTCPAGKLRTLLRPHAFQEAVKECRHEVVPAAGGVHGSNLIGIRKEPLFGILEKTALRPDL